MPEFRTIGLNTKPRNPVYSVGKKYRNVPAYASLLTAALANGDNLVLAGGLTFGTRVARVLSHNVHGALTGAVDTKLGFFQRDTNTGTLKLIKAGSDALLWNNISLVTGVAGDLLLAKNPALDTTKNIGELLALGADQEPVGGVFLVLTFPTKPSANAVLDLEILLEEATTV